MLKADNLAMIRTFYGMSQQELAARLQVSQPYIAQVEGGSRLLSDSLRDRALAALGITPDKLAQIIAIRAGYDAAREKFLK